MVLYDQQTIDKPYKTSINRIQNLNGQKARLKIWVVLFRTNLWFPGDVVSQGYFYMLSENKFQPQKEDFIFYLYHQVFVFA